jgi:hypothetical protein
VVAEGDDLADLTEGEAKGLGGADELQASQGRLVVAASVSTALKCGALR